MGTCSYCCAILIAFIRVLSYPCSRTIAFSKASTRYSRVNDSQAAPHSKLKTQTPKLKAPPGWVIDQPAIRGRCRFGAECSAKSN
jgi:hypothetical protein